jgi:hypothetical protein
VPTIKNFLFLLHEQEIKFGEKSGAYFISFATVFWRLI